MKINPPKPFTNIAISLSGGGYRAVAFHLGALSLLDEIKFSYSDSQEEEKSLLEKVKVLSTVSGGTIVGAMYAIHAADGKSFKTTYKKIYQLLSDDTLLEDGLNMLKPKANWAAPHRNINLINAFAEVYHDKFYDKKTFKTLFDDTDKNRDLPDNEGGLQEIIFNATEFTNSLHFRFQTGGDFGNGKMEMNRKIASDIRIADAVAASSCFPSGFEPLEMPRDFSNGKGSAILKHWKDKGYLKTALMDGGIVDNQGIDSVLKAEDRNDNKKDEHGKKLPFIGTFIISDVTQEMNPYVVPGTALPKEGAENYQEKLAAYYKIPKKEASKEGLSIKKFNNVLMIIGILCGLGFLLNLYFGFKNLATCFGLFASILILVYFVFYSKGWNGLKNALEKELGRQKLLNLSSLNILQNVPIRILKHLITYRVSTTLHMVNNIFMKRIRDLQINRLFNNKYWKYRTTTNYIYTLAKVDPALLGKKIPPIIAYANGMDTSLWFTKDQKYDRENNQDDHMLQQLIVCGQITLCFNLIKYIEALKKQDEYETFSPIHQKDIKNLEKKLNGLFESSKDNFKENPYWLIEKLKNPVA